MLPTGFQTEVQLPGGVTGYKDFSGVTYIPSPTGYKPYTGNLATPVPSASVQATQTEIKKEPSIISTDDFRQTAKDNLSKIQAELQRIQDNARKLEEQQRNRDEIARQSSVVEPWMRDASGNIVPNPNYKQAGTLTRKELQDLGLASGEEPTGTVLSPLQQQEYELNKQYESAQAEMDRLSLVADEQTAALISGIKSQFAQRREQMKDINNRSQQALEQMGIKTGGGRYSASFTGIMSAEERAGIDRITDLDRQEQDLIREAQAAATSKKYDLLSKKMAAIESRRKDLNSQISEFNKTVVEKNKELEKRAREAKISGSVSSLIQSGVSDPLTILGRLQGSGMDISFKEVNDIVKELNEVEKFAPGIIGELQAAKKLGYVGPDMTVEQFLDLKEPGRGLELQQKMLQIAKLQKDLSDTGSTEDPSNILAYAQQYASTGQIPTGLPKGTFGVVAATAKALPKQSGVIVDRNTGVKSGSVGAALEGGFGSLYSAVKLAEELRELDKQRSSGIIAGTLGKVFGSEAQQKYVDLQTQIVDLLARARTGAAMTANEEKFYGNMLPGRLAEPLGLGPDTQTRINNFINNLSNDLENKTRAQGLAVYGFSKVKVGDKEYRVGDVVTNAEGKSARILPNGTLLEL